MNSKESSKIRVFFTRTIILAIGIIMLGLMVFATPTVAESNESPKEVTMSNFFMKLIGDTIGVFKVSENHDDKKLFGSIIINPLEIIQREVGCLDGCKVKDKDMVGLSEDVNKQAANLVINPFKLKDEDVNKAGAVVDMIGDPKDNSKKKILIYHTHTNEAYAEGRNGLSTTVAAVGDELTSQLETLGFTVIHDKTEHDVIDYNNAYSYSKETFLKYLNSYGDFDLIIDLHRDGGPSKERVTTELNGESVARIMFVTTELDPRVDAHMSNINSLIDITNSMYPGLMRDKSITTYPSGINFYSQDLSDNAILMEVGADVNTLQEAKNSMKYMSRVFATRLNN